MKKIISTSAVIISLLFQNRESFAQNISVNTTGAANSTLSMLEVLQISTTANTKGLHVAHSGAIVGTGYGVWAEKTGASTTNIAGYFSATGATNNYAGIFENGSVGIGTSSPLEKFHTSGGNMLLDPSYFLQGLGLGVTRVAMIGMTPGLSPTPGFMRIGDASANYSDLVIFTSSYGSSGVNILSGTTGNSIAYFKENENVGIGTTSPTSKLSVGASSQFQVNSTGNIVRINNVPYSFPAVQGGASTFIQNDGAGNLSWGAAPGTARWDQIAAPTANLSLAHAAFTTSFTFNSVTTANAFALSSSSLTSGNLLNLSSASTAGIVSGLSKILNLSRSGANANASHTAYGLYSAVTNTGATSTNVGGYFTASGATNNYAIIVPSTGGNVGIGTTNPNQQLEITGNFRLPASTATTGIIYSAGNRYIHNYGTNNFFAGVGSGNFTLTGNTNVGIGVSALTANTSGDLNTAIGYAALFSNTTGDQNTASGLQALYTNDIGIQNTAFGMNSLFSNTSGNINVACGFYALYSVSSGLGNTAIGYYAGNSGTSITTGTYNTFLGNSTSSDLATRTNSIAIGGFGNLAFGGDNRVRVGNSSMSSIGGQVGWTTISDVRTKTNVQENVPGLAFIKELRPVTYHYDTDKEHELMWGKIDPTNWNGKYDIEKIPFSGFIAQEVEASANKIGYSFSGVDKPQDKGGLYGLRYAEFVVPLVKSVQELNTKNESLQNEISELSARIETLEKTLQSQISSSAKK